MPSIAVLITYYNERELLTDCLNSLLLGEEQPNEILIYDDASQHSPEQYVPSGCPTTIIHGEVNRGPSFGRNALLRESQCDYIHFHDADDLFLPDWCRRVRRTIEDTQVDSIFTEISSYSNGSLVCERVLGIEQLLNEKDLLRFAIRGAILVPAGTYSRAKVVELGGYREDLWQSEDYDFHVRLAASGLSYQVITDPLIQIRIRPSSRSQDRLEVWTSAIKAIARLASELPIDYRVDLAEAAARIGSSLYRMSAFTEARGAFNLAYDIGPPTYAQQRSVYRIVAGRYGPEVAENFGAIYRNIMPEKVRKFLASNNWC